MSEEREPVRLRDDPAEDAGLRAMLEAAQGEHADDALLERVLAGVLAGGGGGGGTSGGGGATAFSKLAASTAAAVAVAASVAWIASTGVGPAPPAPPAHVVLRTGDAATLLDAGPADAGSGDAGPDAAASEQDADAGRRVVSRAPAPPRDPGPGDAALILAATRARVSDPARSLALALEHRERFPESAAAEDREALVVLDLAALDRGPEARRAAESFRARWPRSAALPHIDAALARTSSP